PDECHCDETNSAPDFACILEVMRRLINLAVSVGVAISVVVIAVAGIMYITSPVSAENRKRARAIVTDVIIGLILVLGAWLAVDFVMKIFYNGKWGPWNSILDDSHAKKCLTVTQAPAGVGVTGEGPITASTTPGGPVQPNTSGPNCPAADPSSVVAFPSSA